MNQPQTLNLETLVLVKGSHPNRSNGLCVMEAVAWLAGAPHSDRPPCACPVVSAFLRHLNDRMPDGARQRLIPLIPTVVGSRASAAVGRRRAYLAADFAVREAAPWALEAVGLHAEAARLRACAPVVDEASARQARDSARQARAADAAAADAADAAADAAAHAAAADAAAHAAYAADAADAAAADAADAAAAAADAAADTARRDRIWTAAIACAERMLTTQESEA